MREIKFLGCLVMAAACARSGAGTDSATTRNSAIVAGPPAVPSSATPVSDSQRGTPPSPGRGRQTASAASPASATAPSSQPSVPIVADSVRGIVSVVGTSFEKRVMVAVPGSGRRVEITGGLAALVGHVAGADVLVVGRSGGPGLAATGFVVRTVDGQPAIDGTLKTEGANLYIVTAGGSRTHIVAPPPPLMGKDGSRVWITGDPSRGVASFGFIDPPR